MLTLIVRSCVRQRRYIYPNVQDFPKRNVVQEYKDAAKEEDQPYSKFYTKNKMNILFPIPVGYVPKRISIKMPYPAVSIGEIMEFYSGWYDDHIELMIDSIQASLNDLQLLLRYSIISAADFSVFAQNITACIEADEETMLSYCPRKFCYELHTEIAKKVQADELMNCNYILEDIASKIEQLRKLYVLVGDMSIFWHANIENTAKDMAAELDDLFFNRCIRCTALCEAIRVSGAYKTYLVTNDLVGL
jgi:hypothetical protein